MVQRAAASAARREVADVEATAHDQVVVAGEADVGEVGRQRRAGVGRRPVADDVAQAPDRVRRAVLLVDVCKHRGEGRQVAVDVGDDRYAHARTFTGSLTTADSPASVRSPDPDGS